jgi:hypothetical protein
VFRLFFFQFCFCIKKPLNDFTLPIDLSNWFDIDVAVNKRKEIIQIIYKIESAQHEQEATNTESISNSSQTKKEETGVKEESIEMVPSLYQQESSEPHLTIVETKSVNTRRHLIRSNLKNSATPMDLDINITNDEKMDINTSEDNIIKINEKRMTRRTRNIIDELENT